MLPDHQVDEILEELTSPSSSHRVHMAVELAATPLADARVLEALEALLDDTAPTIIQIPITIGEVRWQ
jgi:HEAT repeat protein